jgi:hypothetical protein
MKQQPERTMTEQPPGKLAKRRRVVKWLALSLATVVLLLADYFALYCVWLWDGNTPAPTLDRIIPPRLIVPAHRYVESDRPGSDSLFTIAIWSRLHGEWTWKECHAYMRDIKHDEPLYESHPQQIAREAAYKANPVTTPSPSAETCPTSTPE